jgi:hypothetical protein
LYRAVGYIGYVRYIDIISKGIQDLIILFRSIYALKWSVSASSVCVCLGDCVSQLIPAKRTCMKDTGKKNVTAE